MGTQTAATSPLPTRSGVPDEVQAFTTLTQRLASRVEEERGQPSHPGIDVLGVGTTQIRQNIVRLLWDAHEVVSVHPSITAEVACTGQAAEAALAERGVRMVSVYDRAGVEPDAIDIVTAADSSPSAMLCSGASVKMKLVDRRTVVLAGPLLRDEQSALVVTTPAIVAAAARYCQRLRTGAAPLNRRGPQSPARMFTPRQWQVATLMANDLGDAVIATRLGVSVRTVRHEVAEILRILDARSRFSAGIRLGAMGALLDPSIPSLPVVSPQLPMDPVIEAGAAPRSSAPAAPACTTRRGQHP